jgi:hypothetical protein
MNISALQVVDLLLDLVDSVIKQAQASTDVQRTYSRWEVTLMIVSSWPSDESLPSNKGDLPSV